MNKSVQPPGEPGSSSQGRAGLEALGARIRKAREVRGVSLREFARMLGVSPSLISQIERGRVMPSVGTLYAISNELELTFDDMFSANEQPEARPEPAAAVASAEVGAGPVQRGHNRKRIRLAGGVQWERLTPGHDEQLEFVHVVYEVGASSCPEDALFRHPGREYAYVLSGRLGVRIGFEEYELGPGDSLSFSSQIPHRLWTIGDEPVAAIWAILNRAKE
ncbi:MAG TPA: XRE family transcriptional regulator [Microvirga sp.]|nr:XRE family transcriptional regulator [Microvirga sp.]